MFLSELKQLVAAHVPYKNFFAIPRMDKYNQFKENKEENKEENKDSEQENQKFERRQYSVAYFEPENQATARRFVDQFNSKQFSYECKQKTTNYKRYSNLQWNLRMVNTDFESLMVMKSNREERMNTILYSDSRKLNDMHQKFLERLFYEKKDKKTERETR